MVIRRMSSEINPSLHSPLVLAYIGDAVYEVFTREKILEINPNLPAHKLHKANVHYVRANAQSNAMAVIEPTLSDEELAIYKRGRNAKAGTVPKNADLTDYRRATGFEALVGYLYLKKDYIRLNEIMEMAFKSAEDKKQEE